MGRNKRLFDTKSPEMSDAVREQFAQLAKERFPGTWRIAANCLEMGFLLGVWSTVQLLEKADKLQEARNGKTEAAGAPEPGK